MKRYLNTLYITLEGAYLRKDGAAVIVAQGGEDKLRVPFQNLESIACFGWDTTASAALMAACADADVSLSFHTPGGRFLAATRGFTSGNITLRRMQYRAADSEDFVLSIAKSIIAAKVNNSRCALQRFSRDHGQSFPERKAHLSQAVAVLKTRLNSLSRAKSLDVARGIEGEAARVHYGVISELITKEEEAFKFKERSRRPPLDPINSLLSFAYSLLMNDCKSALESCGLDPQCGFLHSDRPGRPSLALDLMEEFRTPLAERAVLSMINRGEITPKAFGKGVTGAVTLLAEPRKSFIRAWQERKSRVLRHPFLNEDITIGLLPHIQARLFARHLRGELDIYPAFLSR